MPSALVGTPIDGEAALGKPPAAVDFAQRVVVDAGDAGGAAALRDRGEVRLQRCGIAVAVDEQVADDVPHPTAGAPHHLGERHAPAHRVTAGDLEAALLEERRRIAIAVAAVDRVVVAGDELLDRYRVFNGKPHRSPPFPSYARN